MNWNSLALSVVLMGFGVLTGFAVAEVGYLGILEAGIANWGALQIFVDLIILGSLAIGWMVIDARRVGLNPWPFVVLTLFLGSFGPLSYLLRRVWGSNRAATLSASL